MWTFKNYKILNQVWQAISSKSNKPIMGFRKDRIAAVKPIDKEFTDTVYMDDDELLALIDQELLGTSEFQESN